MNTVKYMCLDRITERMGNAAEDVDMTDYPCPSVIFDFLAS